MNDSTQQEDFYAALGMDTGAHESDFNQYYPLYAQKLAEQIETKDKDLKDLRVMATKVRDLKIFFSGSHGEIRSYTPSGKPSRFARVENTHKKDFECLLAIAAMVPQLINDIIMARWHSITQSRMVKETRQIRTETIAAGEKVSGVTRVVRRFEDAYRDHWKKLVDSGAAIDKKSLYELAKVYAGVIECPRDIYLKKRADDKAARKAEKE